MRHLSDIEILKGNIGGWMLEKVANWHHTVGQIHFLEKKFDFCLKGNVIT